MYLFLKILLFTIIIPCIVGLVRLKKINRTYHPFIAFLWLGFLNELIGEFTNKYFSTNVVNCNIYTILEANLLVYLLWQWDLFEKKLSFFSVLFALWIFWIAEIFYFSNIMVFDSYFIIFYSLVIVVLSISMLNKILSVERARPVNNPKFVILLCLILFYSYSGVIEIFWKWSFSRGEAVSASYYYIITYLNFINNIFYTYAILCMRRKLRFTMQ